MSNDSKARLSANGPMETKEQIAEVTRASLGMVETDLDYLKAEKPDGPRYITVMRRVADRLSVQAARIRLAIGYGGEI